jgi:hypothetical protein
MSNDDFFRAVAANSRREQRERIKKGLAVVKAAKKAGLPIKSAVVEGTVLELGEADPPEKAILTPLEAWKEMKRARSA